MRNHRRLLDVRQFGDGKESCVLTPLLLPGCPVFADKMERVAIGVEGKREDEFSDEIDPRTNRSSNRALSGMREIESTTTTTIEKDMAADNECLF